MATERDPLLALSELLLERLDWLTVTAVPRGPNTYDIAITVDGTYARDGGLATEAETVTHWANRLNDALKGTCERR